MHTPWARCVRPVVYRLHRLDHQVRTTCAPMHAHWHLWLVLVHWENCINASDSPWRLCVAPMMDWTDRHCRYFHRQIAPGARLYTEMITTGALLHGDIARHLDFDVAEHP